eukprot:6284160-Lingulodinium_polyedra.AAC.2
MSSKIVASSRARWARGWKSRAGCEIRWNQLRRGTAAAVRAQSAQPARAAAVRDTSPALSSACNAGA